MWCIKAALEPAKALRRLPVVVLAGLRRAFKSTLLLNEPVAMRERTCDTLDDFATLAAARANPDSLLAGPVVLDEA